MEKKSNNSFAVLSAINCNEHTEKKNGLTYLSWAWAWQIVKQNFPDAFYTIYENSNGLFYHTDGRTCWVKTGVTIDGVEHIEYLPVMDYRNASISVDKVTSFDVNKTIQRSLTKAVARHGLGLYIYAGEDLPDKEDDAKRNAVKVSKPKAEPASAPVDDDLALALDEVRRANTLDKLGQVYRSWVMYADNAQFLQACSERKKAIKNNQK